MDLLHHALQEKLKHIGEERGRWQQYANDYTQAEHNLIGFRESLQKDILVPIGSKAMMPGKLYHTNEIFVGMYSGLFVKCSSHKAIELCKHRLQKSKERLDALDAEYKMYKDRIDLPMAEDAFGNPAEAQEIIEEYNEAEELKWREQHKIRVREQKQREAVERREQGKSEATDDTNIMEILERAELMEELENELEELDVMNDEHLQQHLQSNGTNGLSNGDGNATRGNQPESGDGQDFDDDDIVPEEFQEISRTAANMSYEAKLHFYENHLREIADYLSTRKFSRFEDLKELADKRGVQECLRNAIGEMVEEKAKSDCEGTQTALNGNLEMNEPPCDSVCALSPPDGRKCLTVAEFKQLEEPYLNRSRGVALVFYKSQLRSVMKTIASCSKGANVDHMNEKRELYEYINDCIDRLRADILREKQAKLEEKFVDDDTDNEAPADEDDGLNIDGDVDDNEPDSLEANPSNDDAAIAPVDSAIISPSKRKICFAAKPSVTTYHLDDEPWRVQNSSGETDETINSLMDQTFQFFNSPGSSSSSSVCDYDGHDDDSNQAGVAARANSTNECDEGAMETNLCALTSNCDDDDDINRLEPISQRIPSATKTLFYKDGSTLFLKFAHTATPPLQPSPIGLPTENAITSPIDIYKQFGGDTIAANAAPADHIDAENQKLKDYVMKVANLNTDELHQKMANYLAGKSGSESLPNGNRASPVPKTPPAEPKKSILKNCEAVKREIHGKIYDQIEDEESTQNFYTQDRSDPFISFDQVLGDICERPTEVAFNNNNNKSDAVAISSDSFPQRKKRVSLFKMNRMS